MTQTPVRIGVIGAGWFASRRHLPAILRGPDCELAAICRRDPHALHQLAGAFHVPEERCFTDWRALLSSTELDAVLIATPHTLHFEPALSALEQGLHVLLEKPMTVRLDEAKQLEALAASKGLQLGVALNPPFWAHCHRMRARVAAGDLGELESASIYWTGSAEYVFGRAPKPDNLPGIVPPTMYRADLSLSGGGYFIDGGSHLVSELLWVTGRTPKRVTSMMDAAPLDMRCSLVVEMDNGAIATINSIGDSRSGSRRVRNIFGFSGGTITVTDFEFHTEIRVGNEQPEIFSEADLQKVSEPVPNFVDAVLGRGGLYSPASHGRDVVAVIEAAYRAQDTGMAQDI